MCEKSIFVLVFLSVRNLSECVYEPILIIGTHRKQF
jgi:hypothetical protein